MATLPEGVWVRALEAIPDERGAFTEVYRNEWTSGPAAIQWNFARSRAGVMRGVRVHPRHDDYVVALEGELQIGVCDLRRRSGTFRKTAVVELRSAPPSLLRVPAGVAHGLYTTVPSFIMIGVTEYFDPEDDLPCRWDDPELGIVWPFATALISPSDAAGLPVAELIARVDPG